MLTSGFIVKLTILWQHQPPHLEKNSSRANARPSVFFRNIVLLIFWNEGLPTTTLLVTSKGRAIFIVYRNFVLENKSKDELSKQIKTYCRLHGVFCLMSGFPNCGPRQLHRWPLRSWQETKKSHIGYTLHTAPTYPVKDNYRSYLQLK